MSRRWKCFIFVVCLAPSMMPFAATAAGNNEFLQALAKVKAGDAEGATQILYALTKRGSRAQREKAVYLLGQVLVKMHLYQAASFRFLDIVKLGKGRYFNGSLARLFATADQVDSQSFLAYAVKKVVETKNSVGRSQSFAYRYGEYLIQTRKFNEAAKILGAVSPKSRDYSKAKYLQGLAYAELKKEPQALKAYLQLLNHHAKDPVDGYDINAARVGVARIYYQRQKWEQAIDYYRRVPKDSDLWHEVLFELSWAHLRASQFRQALGVLSSLHSAYYEDYFLPESILVRALVYLQICQDDEMEKTLSLFKQVYLPMRRRLADYLKNTRKYSQFYEDAKAEVLAIHDGTVTDEMRAKAPIPLPIVQTITRNPELKKTFRYMQNLRQEQQYFLRRSPEWRGSALGKDVSGLIERRLAFAKKAIGRQIRKHLQLTRRQFATFFREFDFINYEMQAAKKRRARQKLVKNEKNGKAKNPPAPKTEAVDAGLDREFFSAKGIEYWPFQGEYWLDEIGNYHFLGKSLCEKKL